MEIQIYRDAGIGMTDVLETKTHVFSGGELLVKVPGIPDEFGDDIAVVARIQSSDDLVRLSLLTSLLDRKHDGKRTLVIPYMPYARDDRIMERDRAFGLKTIALLIYSMGYDRHVVVDPHSGATETFFDRCDVMSQADIMRRYDSIRMRHDVTVGPDKGSESKAGEVAKCLGTELVIADKVRDVSTGRILSLEVRDPGRVHGKRCLIADDIADGGATFVMLAISLRMAGASSVDLYVTHGIFSRGLELFDGLIDHIYTTDAFVSPYIKPQDHKNLTVFNFQFNNQGVIL